VNNDKNIKRKEMKHEVIHPQTINTHYITQVSNVFVTQNQKN